MSCLRCSSFLLYRSSSVQSCLSIRSLDPGASARPRPCASARQRLQSGLPYAHRLPLGDIFRSLPSLLCILGHIDDEPRRLPWRQLSLVACFEDCLHLEGVMTRLLSIEAMLCLLLEHGPSDAGTDWGRQPARTGMTELASGGAAPAVADGKNHRVTVCPEDDLAISYSNSHFRSHSVRVEISVLVHLSFFFLNPIILYLSCTASISHFVYCTGIPIGAGGSQ